jgi:benzoate membrane transport protein
VPVPVPVRSFRRDLSLSAVVAGFVAMLVGVTSSIVVVFQAAQALGATPAQVTSWIWSICVGTGLTSIGLSVWYRRPVLTAWATPGAALLVSAAAGVTMPEAIGGFLVSAALITLSGLTGLFARVMDRIPQPLAAGLLGGVLARFALDAFGAMPGDPGLVGSMFLAYLFGRRFWPRYAVPGVLAVGLGVAWALGRMHLDTVDWRLGMPVWTAPAFTLRGLFGVALPLFVVTMASQNLPGVAAQRAAGYDTPVSPVIATTGLATLLLAPFGGYALNLAAITASICMSREAHEDPARRWPSAVMAGLFYLGVGLAAGAVAGLIGAFPKALVLAVAGFALLGTIGGGLGVAMADLRWREPALVTFLVTLSGLSMAGIGSAFWGVVAGAVCVAITTPRR